LADGERVLTDPATTIANTEVLRAPGESEPGLVAASALTFGASIAGLVIALFRSKLLAVLLGPSGVAVLANIGTYSSLALVVGNAFTGQGATRSIAEARAAGRSTDIRWLIRYTLALPMVIGLAIFAITALWAPSISSLITGTVNYSGLIVLSSAFIPVLLVAAAYGQVLQAFIKVARIAAASVVGSVALIGATVLLTIPFGLTGAVVAIGVGAAVRVAYLAHTERWVLSGWAGRQRPSGARPPLSPILKLSLSSAILGIAAAAVALLIRTSIVGILGLEQNGIYQPVSDISDIYLEVILASTSLYLFPKMTALLTLDKRAEAAHELGHGMRLLLVITVPVALIGIGFGEVVIRTLYSASFTDASGPLAIQMAGNIVKVVAWSLGAGLLPLGMYRSWLVIGLVTLAIRYFGVVALAPSMGLDGVAVAYVLAWLWAAGSAAVAVGFVSRLWPSRHDWRATGVGATLVAISLAAAWYSPVMGNLVSLIAAIAWVAVTRGDLIELASEITRRGGLKWPWGANA
jgi:PST family polysaccharide transporter